MMCHFLGVYDTDIECVVKEVVTCGDGDVIYVDQVESLIIQHVSSDDFEEDINTKSHVLMWFGKSIIIMVNKSSFKFVIGKKYQEGYLIAAPMVDKFVFKMIKVREVGFKGESEDEEDSWKSLSQAGENDAGEEKFYVERRS
ncbi:hypothetical protein Tco_1338798 [Tanacetum coccineum]